MPKVPLTWLAESVDLVPGARADDVAAALSRVGLEEEGIDGPTLTGPLVVGKVLSAVAETASNGKSINYCRVDVGEHNDPAGPGHKPDDQVDYPASRGIVCGAHNFSAGDYVVVVLPGANLPGPFPISGRKTYGHWSDGMICSARELGLGEDHSGILVLTSPAADNDHLGFDAESLTPGQDAIALLGLDEATIEINVTPDRGYAFSIRGVAREYSHATGQSWRDPALLPVTGNAGDGPAILIEDDAPIRGRRGCSRFAARILRGVDPGAASPSWMRRRLEQSGMRPISLIVDVTNYVMLELGQPLHAYDLATVTAPIVVRRAASGESLTTLDDQVRSLDDEDLLITDSTGGHGARPVGLAGVMGGLDTEISASTTDILLEAAHFDAVSIARTARRHKLGSEASRRFERGVDSALPPVALERALRLIQEFGGGDLDEVWTDVGEAIAATSISMGVDFPSRVVGVDYAAETVISRLEQVGCAVVDHGGTVTVIPPTWRPDLDSPITLVEEVARLEGYESLPSILPVAPPGRGYTHAQQVRSSVARTLAESGLTEVLTYPFVGTERLDEMLLPQDSSHRRLVRLANPLNAQQPYLRSQLLQTLVEAAKVNVGRGAQDVAIFEVGRVFVAPEDDAVLPSFDGSVGLDQVASADAALPQQGRRVAALMCGNRTIASWNSSAEPFEWNDAVESALRAGRAAGVELTVTAGAYGPWHPGRCAALALDDGTHVGFAGELHPKVLDTWGLPARSVAFDIALDPIIDAGQGRIANADPISAQMPAKEDFAFVVAASLPAADLVRRVRVAGGELVEQVRVFDVYTGEQIGEGKKSVAVSVIMRAADRTLSAEEVLGVREAVVAGVGQEFDAVLR